MEQKLYKKSDAVKLDLSTYNSKCQLERTKPLLNPNENNMERTKRMHDLNGKITERTKLIHDKNEKNMERTKLIHDASEKNVERTKLLGDSNKRNTERTKLIHDLNEKNMERTKLIIDRNEKKMDDEFDKISDDVDDLNGVGEMIDCRISDLVGNPRLLRRLIAEFRKLRKRVAELEARPCFFCGSKSTSNDLENDIKAKNAWTERKRTFVSDKKSFDFKLGEINRRFSDVHGTTNHAVVDKNKNFSSDLNINKTNDKLKMNSCSVIGNGKINNNNEVTELSSSIHQNMPASDADKIDKKDDSYIQEFDNILNLLNHNSDIFERYIARTRQLKTPKTLTEAKSVPVSRYLATSPTNQEKKRTTTKKKSSIFLPRIADQLTRMNRSTSLTDSPKVNFRNKLPLSPMQVFTAPVVTDLSPITSNDNCLFKTIEERRLKVGGRRNNNQNNNDNKDFNEKIASLSSSTSSLAFSAAENGTSASSSSLSFDEATYDGTFGEITFKTS